MKQMIILSLLTLVHLQAVAADSTDNTQFSYAAATAAFAKAPPVTQAEILAKWTLIGQVSSPSRTTTDGDGYWPDGKYTQAGYSGYFKTVATVASIADAFGNSALTFSSSQIGAETGKVYSTSDTRTGVVGNTGFDYDIPADSSTCANAVECRIVTAEKMLLCAYTVDDMTDQCRHYSQTEPALFLGWAQLP